MIEEKIKKTASGAQQFEVRQEIFFEPEMRQVRYRIETYIFSPVSLQLNSQNYKPVDCLQLFKNYIRLRAPSLDLSKLVKGSEPEQRLEQAFEFYQRMPECTDETVFMTACKLFALTFKRSIRLKERDLSRQEHLTESDIQTYIDQVNEALDCYRSTREKLRELGQKLNSECDRFCDEYITTTLLHFTQRLMKSIHDEGLKQPLKVFWDDQYRYLQTNHRQSLYEGEHADERTLYRWRQLTRYVDSYLFLNIKSHTGPTMLVHSLYGIAAAVSMIFATVIAFVWQGQYGALSTNLFLALVIGYIFKDRIKDMLREKLAKKFRRWIPDRRLEILRDDTHNVGECKESFEFLDEKSLPASIRILREGAQSEKGVYDWRFDNILRYKKEMSIRTDASLFNDTRYALLDTTWFNIAPFLKFIDASRDALPIANPETMDVPVAEKIYHLYFVRRLIKVTLKGEETIKDEVIRVVINHDGIKRIQALDS